MSARYCARDPALTVIAVARLRHKGVLRRIAARRNYLQSLIFARRLKRNRRQTVLFAGDGAGIVARLAGAAHLGSHRIDFTRGLKPNSTRKRSAPIPGAAHSATVRGHELRRDAGERFVFLRAEPGPLPRSSAARPAGSARRAFCAIKAHGPFPTPNATEPPFDGRLCRINSACPRM